MATIVSGVIADKISKTTNTNGNNSTIREAVIFILIICIVMYVSYKLGYTWSSSTPVNVYIIEPGSNITSSNSTIVPIPAQSQTKQSSFIRNLAKTSKAPGRQIPGMPNVPSNFLSNPISKFGTPNHQVQSLFIKK
jgi:hypothetical protein